MKKSKGKADQVTEEIEMSKLHVSFAREEHMPEVGSWALTMVVFANSRSFRLLAMRQCRRHSNVLAVRHFVL